MSSINPLKVRLRLQNVHCFDEGDAAGNAEPYLWTVFFKIDGDTVVVDRNFTLKGKATVVTTSGDHGDLATNVDAGDDLPISRQLGEFRTVLQPIPIENFSETIGGTIGCVAVLLEEDNTPNEAIAQGHRALNDALQRELDNLISTLSIKKKDVSPEEVAAINNRIDEAVTRAVTEEVSVWEWLGGGGDMDDTLGAGIFRFSYSDLQESSPTGRRFSERMSRGDNLLARHLGALAVPVVGPALSAVSLFEDAVAGNGDWEITGQITAHPIPYSMRRLLAAVGADPNRGVRTPLAAVGVSTVREFIEVVA